MKLGFSSDGWSRLSGSLVAQTFDRVTDKISSSILILLNKNTDIYTENDGIIKTKWNEEFIKNAGIFYEGELFNKCGEWS